MTEIDDEWFEKVGVMTPFYWFSNASGLYEAAALKGYTPWAASRQGDCVAIFAPKGTKKEDLPEEGCGYMWLPWEKPEEVLWWTTEGTEKPA